MSGDSVERKVHLQPPTVLRDGEGNGWSAWSLDCRRRDCEKAGPS